LKIKLPYFTPILIKVKNMTLPYISKNSKKIFSSKGCCLVE